jgi:hypothetical protein
MLNSAVFNFAGKSQILRFIYHKLDMSDTEQVADYFFFSRKRGLIQVKLFKLPLSIG